MIWIALAVIVVGTLAFKLGVLYLLFVFLLPWLKLALLAAVTIAVLLWMRRRRRYSKDLKHPLQ